MKIDGIEIEFNEVEFKIVCIKNFEESVTAKRWWVHNKPRKK
jgi:hypothetical protein